jgi:hypothetical protein
MNEEVIRILQDALATVSSLSEELNRARDLEVEEIVGEDDTGWQAVNDASDSTGRLRDELERALIDVTVTAYLVLRDSVAAHACIIGVSPRFPRRLIETTRENRARFDLIVGSSGAIEVRDLEGRTLTSINVDGSHQVRENLGRHPVSFYAFSSIEDAGDKEMECNGDKVTGYTGWFCY